MAAWGWGTEKAHPWHLDVTVSSDQLDNGLRLTFLLWKVRIVTAFHGLLKDLNQIIRMSTHPGRLQFVSILVAGLHRATNFHLNFIYL